MRAAQASSEDTTLPRADRRAAHHAAAPPDPGCRPGREQQATPIGASEAAGVGPDPHSAPASARWRWRPAAAPPPASACGSRPNWCRATCRARRLPTTAAGRSIGPVEASARLPRPGVTPGRRSRGDHLASAARRPGPGRAACAPAGGPAASACRAAHVLEPGCQRGKRVEEHSAGSGPAAIQGVPGLRRVGPQAGQQGAHVPRRSSCGSSPSTRRWAPQRRTRWWTMVVVAGMEIHASGRISA